jgi:2-(1,2-epoxy-1,2-dihydrophenyl)acetyl-CoA isomerase
MPDQFISVETTRGVMRITLNRPEVLNSFNSLMAAEVHAALRTASSDQGVRAVLITGAGRAFCAGQDLAEFQSDGTSRPVDFAAHVRKTYNPIVRAIRALEKPVVCAVNGVAAGAGANLALACDFVIASGTASFLQAFVKIGLVPDTGGTFFLPRLVGLARATAMMMLGEKVTAEEALAHGMIYRVCEPTSLREETEAFAELLATQATRGLGMTKRLLNASLVNDLDAQLDLEAELQGEAGRTTDHAEGVAAFLQKRAPTFEGR